MIKFGVFLGMALASMGAQAGVIDLGAIMGGANVYTAGDFKAISSDVEGAIVSGGNVTIQNYAVNLKNKAAYAGYSIVAGGNISLTSGSIHNGPVYAGGTVTMQSAATLDGQSGRFFLSDGAIQGYRRRTEPGRGDRQGRAPTQCQQAHWQRQWRCGHIQCLG